MQSINTQNPARAQVNPAKATALPIHTLFVVAIIMGFVGNAAIVPFVLQGADGMTLTTLITTAFAFASVGGAAALLGVGTYDVIFNGSLDDK